MLAAPSIVVAPATLLQQWARELATWAPRMPVAVYRKYTRDLRLLVILESILTDCLCL